jgi:O-antigen/teichoic acid export membrane protein
MNAATTNQSNPLPVTLSYFMASQSFIRHALIYGFGSVLVQAAGFILLPLYARCLTLADYGTLEVLNRLGECVVVFLLFGGIRQAALAFHGQSTDGEQQGRVMGSTVMLVSLTALAGGCVMMLFCGPLSRALAVGSASLLQLAVWATVLDGMNFVLLVGPQARREPTFFVIATGTQFVLRILCSVVFVVGLGWGVAGILLATVITSALYSLVLVGHEATRGGGAPDWQTFREMTRFAAVFLPGGLAFFVLNHGDRFLLREFAGLEEVGTYAMGYKIALGVVLFSRASLGTVWNARLYEAARQPEAPAVFGRVITRSLAAYLWGGFALCLFQDEVVWLLGGQAYAAAAGIIPPVVLAYYLLTAADLMDGAFYIRRRPILKTLVALASMIVTCLLYLALIPRGGAMGAALATLAGFFFHALLTLVVSQRVFPVAYEGGRLVVPLSMALFLWVASRFLPMTAWAMVFKAFCWLALPGVLWLAGLVSPEEKRWMLTAGRRLLQRLPPPFRFQHWPLSAHKYPEQRPVSG